MNDPAHRTAPMTASPSIAEGGFEPVIDVAHLSRMTLGDRSLERQVLELFERQAGLLLGRMREVGPAGVATLAHTLCGSARGIGAWRVAHCAETLEQAARARRRIRPALAELAAVIGEARAAIEAMLNDKASA